MRSGRWSRAAEGRACSALLLAVHELRAVAEAAEARGEEAAELAADLRALAHGVEQLERDVLGAFCAAADRHPARVRPRPASAGSTGPSGHKWAAQTRPQHGLLAEQQHRHAIETNPWWMQPFVASHQR